MTDYYIKNGTIQGYYADFEKNLEIIKNSEYVYSQTTGEKLSDLYDILKNSKDCDYKTSTYKKYAKDTKQNKALPVEDLNALDFFSKIKSSIDEVKKDEKTYQQKYLKHRLIKNNIDKIYISWQQEKENLGIQTYSDMLRDVHEAVMDENSALCEKIRRKYKYAIIDEFQDTNQIQWDIFRKVFLYGDNNNIIVVGDPKQSIYSFQGADITVYKKAKKEITENGGYLRCLKCNYRSTADIIESANIFFDNETALTKELSFSSSKVPENAETKFSYKYNGEAKHAFWITENEVSPEKYAEIVCRKIVDFCTKDDSGKTRLQLCENEIGRNVSFKDFAVLARTRTEMKPIMSAFEKYGIPYSLYKDKNLFSGRECANWIAVLEAVNTPDFMGRNRIYFRKAMYTYFFGFSLDEVNDDYFNSDGTEEIKLFDEWRAYAEDRNWERLIESIIEDTGVATKMSGLGLMQQFGTLMQIGEYCAEKLDKTNSLEALINDLRKQMNGCGDNDGGNSNLVAKSTDFDCVQIMTIHASKGLEFPVVISVAGFKGENHNVKNAYSYHSGDKHYLTFADNDTSKEEKKEEYQRLFYVAYTRAKYLLMIPEYPCPKLNKGDNQQLKFISDSVKAFRESSECEKMSVNDLSDLNIKEAVKNILSYRNTKESGDGFKEENFNDRRDEIKKFGESLYFYSSHKHAYSSLSHGGAANETMTDAAIKPDTSDDAVEYEGLAAYDENAVSILLNYNTEKFPEELPSNFPAGTALGNALHAIFEKIDYTHSDADCDDFINDCFKAEDIHFKDEWKSYMQAMVSNVTAAVLPEIHGSASTGNTFSLSGIESKDRCNEAEFNFNKENEKFSHYFNGFVDLIFRRGEYYSILDWKSDRLNEDFTSYSDAEEIKKHTAAHYAIQRVLYSYCLIKWLKNFYKDKTEQEIFEQHFGGIYYVYLRGCKKGTSNGIYAQTWDSFATLEASYKKILNDKVEKEKKA